MKVEVFKMENEKDEITTLEQLEIDISNESDPEKKLKLAQAYKAMKEAQDSDWKTSLELDVENKKSKRTFWATIIAAVAGSTVAGIIKAVANAKYQERAIDAEKDDLYVKPQKMLPPNK